MLLRSKLGAGSHEKMLKNKLGTNNIKVKHTHDSNGLNVYFYYSESLDEDTIKQNNKNACNGTFLCVMKRQEESL